MWLFSIIQFVIFMENDFLEKSIQFELDLWK